MEGLGDVDRFLAEGAVGDEEDLVGLDASAEFFHLFDEVGVDLEASGGVEEDEVGAGRLDIRGILKALLDVKYAGVVTFEYEKTAANPVTGLAESIGYVRGLLRGLA